MTDIEIFMALNLFHCQLLAARITVRQCELNRQSGHVSCGVCSQDRPDKVVVKLPKRAKRHKGDNPGSPWRGQVYDRVALVGHEADQSDRSDRTDCEAIAGMSVDLILDDLEAEVVTEPDQTTLLILQIMVLKHGNEQAAAILRRHHGR